MAPIFSFLIYSGSKKKEPIYEGLSEARASHAHKTWTEVTSSVPHFLQMGLLLSPITYKCHLRVLCPVRIPMTTLGCVLLIDNNCALVAKLGPEINSRACICVLQGPRHIIKCWLFIQRFVLCNRPLCCSEEHSLYISCFTLLTHVYSFRTFHQLATVLCWNDFTFSTHTPQYQTQSRHWRTHCMIWYRVW